MGAIGSIDFRDFTKKKHRILLFITIGIFLIIILFAIIGLACDGSFFWGLVCTVFSVVNLIALGYNVPVTFKLKKEFGITKCTQK